MVVMDVCMLVVNGIDVICWLLLGYDDACWVFVVIMFDIDDYVFGAVWVGASGFLFEDCVLE